MVERAQQKGRLSSTLNLKQIDLIYRVSPDSIAIDCGANVGDVTSSFARTGIQVYAFEPNPLTYGVLSRRFSATPNVKCFNQGVMDKSCTLTLVTPTSHDQYDDLDMTVSSSFVMNEIAPHSSTSQIDCIDLSAFILSLDKRVSVLKIDIEGAEIPVMHRLIDTGAIDRVDLALVETHEVQQPDLLEATTAMRTRIKADGLSDKIRLDWI